MILRLPVFSDHKLVVIGSFAGALNVVAFHLLTRGNNRATKLIGLGIATAAMSASVVSKELDLVASQLLVQPMLGAFAVLARIWNGEHVALMAESAALGVTINFFLVAIKHFEWGSKSSYP